MELDLGMNNGLELCQVKLGEAVVLHVKVSLWMFQMLHYLPQGTLRGLQGAGVWGGIMEAVPG